jgi:hypothetical protein
LISYDKDEKSFLKIHIELKQARFNFVHWQTHTGLAQLNVSNSQTRIFVTADKFFVEGEIGDCALLDTTNYPKTIDCNLKPECLENRF